jgi:DNA polymerase (family 10)
VDYSPPAPVDKAVVVRVLRELALLLQLKGDESAFKARAYDIAADRLSGLGDEQLAERVRAGTLRELPGIGAALEQKITELVTTGRMAYYDQLKADFPPGMVELVKVPDLGPKKAKALWKALGVGDVDALEKACRDGQVRGIKGFGEKSEAKILAGIELFRRTKSDRRRLGDVLAVAHEIAGYVAKAPGVVRSSVAGSVRRFCETVSDVDIIASAAEPGPVMEHFTRHSQVAQVIARGDTKCSVRLFKGELQCDLRVVPDEDFATALHHFTGSKAHHIRLRGLAQDQGLKISEWGVHRDTTKLRVPDEETIYKLLGMQYVPPEMREDWGEVEAALAGKLPGDLVALEDVMGVVHSHSTWSDGKHTLAQMAEAAESLGLRYLTVTDHSQAAHYAGGLKPDDLRRQWDEIDELNAKLKTLRLLKGTEVDILEDGALDFPEKLLERMDVVIGSVHVRHGLDEEAMTRRVIRAFDNPFLHILGHATGRLINSREPYGLKMEQVLDKAAEKGVAVEVNGNPHRLDIKAEYVRLALQRGVKLVVSADSHSISELTHLAYAVGTARKGWARKADVLNTLPAVEFTTALRNMRR